MAVKKLDPPLQLIDSIKNMTNILPIMPVTINDQDMTRYFMNKKFNFIKAKLVSLNFCNYCKKINFSWESRAKAATCQILKGKGVKYFLLGNERDKEAHYLKT